MAGKRLALLVATDTYEDSTFRQLRAPSADVEALRAVLADPAIGAYQVEHLSNAVSHQVNQAIEKFFAEAGLKDLVMLYFSGHGFKDDSGRLYLTTRDSQRQLLASTAVSAQFVREQMDRCRSRRKVVILDCCYAGAFPDGVARGTDTIDVLERLSGRGSAVMTASSAMGYAFEDENSLTVTEIKGMATPSVFTGALIDGLATGSADQDGDGLIDVDELYDHIYKKVRETVPQQTPGWRGNVEGTLYVATSPRGPRPAQLPSEFSDAVQSPLPSVRLAVVTDLASLCSGARLGTLMAVHAALARLAEDDSRRVAAAARSALDEVSERVDLPNSGDRASRRKSGGQPGHPQGSATAARAESTDITSAQQEADRLIADAKADARLEAEKILGKAKERADQIGGDARARAESLERDAVERHRQAMGSLVKQREELECRVDDLRAFEREYRARFTLYLQNQLRDLQRESLDPFDESVSKKELEKHVADLRGFAHEYRTRLTVYLEGQLRDMQTGQSATTE